MLHLSHQHLTLFIAVANQKIIIAFFGAIALQYCTVENQIVPRVHIFLYGQGIMNINKLTKSAIERE